MMNVEGMLKQYASIRRAYAKYLCHSFKNENFSPSEIDILIFLFNNPSINTSKDLKVCLGVSKSLVCRSVETLLQRGLLHMEEDQKDRRMQRLTITEQAYPIIMEIKQCRDSFTEYVMKDVSDDELELIEKIMKKINLNIDMVVRGEMKNENVK
ncbi:MarR family winged helix-turn-helix transcriptional regulator [[Eubacterium] hominis]|uniref:MarR family winged helix-turn-helix transcriptional regulator n=1 Tax=[Eubacterium] hominis TaxID=2764325 RepID=UPI003A4D7E8A